ncbi:MAG: hypothetical protein OIF58_14530, partial [Cohaesibacter sp.]|nr:hypothetical protein [Cohaesibacter sp.]
RVVPWQSLHYPFLRHPGSTLQLLTLRQNRNPEKRRLWSAPLNNLVSTVVFSVAEKIKIINLIDAPFISTGRP